MASTYKALPFAAAELDARLANLRAKMAARGLDGLVLSAPENLYYLTGYDTTGFHSFFQVMVIAGDGEPAIFTRHLEIINFEGTAHRTRGVGYQDHEEPAAALAALLGEMGLARARIGFEKLVPWLTVGVYEALAAALPDARIEDASGLVEELRSIKSPAEVAYMRQAARYTEAGMRAGLDTARVGATDNDVAAAIIAARVRAGSGFMRSPTYVLVGARTELTHQTWQGDRIAAGDLVYIEQGGCARHYAAPLMRTAVVGKASARIREIADASRRSLDAVIAETRPGRPIEDVDAINRALIAEAGLSDYYRHRTGYGVGLDFLTWIERNGMSFNRGNKAPFAPGMTFHLPIVFFVPGVGGIGFSETVLVTEDGCEAITDFPRELEIG